MTARGWVRPAGAALLAALLSFVAVAGMMRLWHQPLDVPLEYATAANGDHQDATLEAMVDADVIQTGWLFHNPRLNAPYQQDWIEWPMGGDTLAFTIKKGIASVTDNPWLVMNVFWLATFPLVALVAQPVLRRLGLSTTTSVASAVLFSLAPYHFRNGPGHENLAFYVGVPLAILLCVQLLGPRPPGWSRNPQLETATANGTSETPATTTRWARRLRPLALPALAAAVIAIDSYYYLAFFLALAGLCALVSAVARRSWRPVLSMAFLGAVTVAVAAVFAAPTILWLRANGANPVTLTARVVGASEDFGLRPVELFAPVAGNRFGPLDWLATNLAPRLNPASSTTANLGLYAGVGVVVALVALGARLLRGPARWRVIDERLGVIVVLAVLLGVSGGGARVVELVAGTSIRAWVRIAVFIAFVGVAATGRLLDRGWARVRQRWPAADRSEPSWARPAWVAVVGLIVVVALLEQVSPSTVPDANANRVAFEADAAFVHDVEARLPAGAMVFQLPPVPFPEAGFVAYTADYDLLKIGYLHSSTARWSAGGIKGRSGDWQLLATQQPLPVLVRGLAAVGFSAITIDRRAYLDLADTEVQTLTDLLGPPYAAHSDRLLAWDLQPYAATQRERSTPEQRDEWTAQMLDAPRFTFSSDVSTGAVPGGTGSFCRTATITTSVPDGRRWPGTLHVHVNRAKGLGPGPLVITVGGVPHVIDGTATDADLPIELSGSTPIVAEAPTFPRCDEGGIQGALVTTFRYT